MDLIDRLGNSDIRRSLRTCNKRVARQRAWTLILVIEEAFAVLRDARLSPGVRAAFDAILDRVMDDFDRDQQAWAERAKYRMLIDSLGTAGNDNAGVDVVAEEVTVPASAATVVLQAAPAAPQPIVVSGSSGSLEDIITQAVRAAQIDPKARRPLSAFVSAYLRHKHEKTQSKTLEDIATKIRIFITAMGDLEAHAYTREHLLDYRDLVDEMPKDAIKFLKTDDLRKAIALNAKRAVLLPTIGPVTVDRKYMSAVHGLFGYLVQLGILKFNPASGVHSRQISDDGEDLLDAEKRLPFSKDQVRQLIARSDRERRTSADYWWPRVAPFTGLRIGEFAQLTAADIREHHGRLCIDLLHTPDGDPDNAKRRAQLYLKSDAAHRVVPLPRIVLTGGFTDLVERRRERDGPLARLFPNETPNHHGAYGQNLSKRVGRDIDEISTDPRLVAHSARHFFAACCDEAGVPLNLRNRLMGHEPDSDTKKSLRRGRHVSARYGSPILSANEMAWIDRLEF
ncbi:tyrosine-type recombinase/integrase [Pelagibacterium halotolerans]